MPTFQRELDPKRSTFYIRRGHTLRFIQLVTAPAQELSAIARRYSADALKSDTQENSAPRRIGSLRNTAKCHSIASICNDGHSGHDGAIRWRARHAG